MAIYKINNNLPTTTKIETLNDMIIELYGLISQGKFDENEITALYDVLGSAYTRKFLRNVSLGHSLLTYSGWSHLIAETGYSIWKFSPTNYLYSILNNLYLDDRVLDNRGLATAESATTFDTVYLYDGSTYTDNTTEAGTDNGTEFSLMDATDNYLYLGSTATFLGIKFEFQTRGSNYTLKVEYYDGTSGINDWVELTANTDSLSDATSNFESDGRISWELPEGWEENSVEGVSRYWIRISTTTVPVTVAEAYYIIPADSVVALLALSSSEILDEDWAWCTYVNDIYVTIRNSGQTAYEGDYYITSSSSSTNKQNFFVYNHELKADYQDSTF